ncbi:MAG TPA: c-type cytochrome biogenesis protein CcsB [Elusimicrobia bacterium]|nr:c-type cytochrome biogenesis protein CcsB [Elusimicrobiota bacterium]HBT60577.1 c-type cytochrome biogenesis protein CcsB [Elusimicrobiota bacterium]
MEILNKAAFALCLAGLLTGAAGVFWRLKTAEKLSQWALLACVLSLSAALAARWRICGRPPMTDQYESLLILAWCVGAGGLIARRRSGVAAVGVLSCASCAAALAGASLLDPSVRPLMPALRSDWLAYHVLTAMASYAAFALAAAAGAWRLISSRGAGADEPLERLMIGALKAGFFLLTLGIATGAVWAQRAWGSYWSWDPKETWSLITWLVYAVVLHLRRAERLSGRALAWSCIAGAGVVLFTYIGVNRFLGGLHSYSGL